MKRKRKLLLLIKEREEGLLSVLDDSAKSMLSLLGGAKLIDYYISSVDRRYIDSITVLCDEESGSIAEHIGYYYREAGVHSIVYENFFDTLMEETESASSEVLILRVDPFLIVDWKRFIETFSKNNYLIRFSKNDYFGIYLGEISSWIKLLKKAGDDLAFEKNNDNIWRKIVGLLKENKSVRPDGIIYYNPLATVKDYYDLHMRAIEDIRNWYGIISLPDRFVFQGENEIVIGRSGKVKNSYISMSCSVDGTVENSFIFYNTRISGGAYIKGSIVMENNFIAENGKIYNSILRGGGELFQNLVPSVEDSVKIGEEFSQFTESESNHDYPDYIFGGITLIGRGVQVPKRFVVGANCYIESGVGRSKLRSIKNLQRGKSVLIR